MNSVILNKNLNVHPDFNEFVNTTQCRINEMIIGLPLTGEVDYLMAINNGEMISFIPKSKAHLVTDDDAYTSPLRIQAKVGRIISKLFDENQIRRFTSSKEIEIFVNLYKSFFDRTSISMEIVSGEELRKAYYERNYYAPQGNRCGSLWNSCMRYAERQKGLDLYVENDIKMLVMYMMEQGHKKVRARALLWETKDDYGRSVKVMDRIYYVYEQDINTFKRWAVENNYISKYLQNAKSQNLFDVNGSLAKINLKIDLKKKDFGLYPYLDTFQFINMSKGVVYNNQNHRFDYTLIQANGDVNPSRREEDLVMDDDDDSEEW